MDLTDEEHVLVDEVGLVHLKLGHLLGAVGLVGGDVDDAGDELLDDVAGEEGGPDCLHDGAEEVGPAHRHGART